MVACKENSKNNEEKDNKSSIVGDLQLDIGKGGFGFIDKSGNEVIPCEYQYTDSFSDGLAIVEYQGETWYDEYRGYINKDGELVFGGYYDAYPFHAGYAVVEVGDYNSSKFGIIDKENNVVVPIEYEAITYLTHDEKTGVVVYEISGSEEGSEDVHYYYYVVINSKGVCGLKR